MGIVQIQLVDLFTTPVIKMMTLRSKPKRQYHPRGRHEGHNVHFQNSESKAVLRCSGPKCLLCGRSGRSLRLHQCPQAAPFCHLVWFYEYKLRSILDHRNSPFGVEESQRIGAHRIIFVM